MRVEIIPGKAKGCICAPPSKSMAHRMLMGAGLASGTSVIENVDLSEDIKATLGILEALGCKYQIKDKQVTMSGIGKKNLKTNQVLECNESGSTLRFFIPLLLTGGEKVCFSGAKRLMERPLDIYEDICREQHISYKKSEEILELNGQIHASHFKVKGNISSQFITGLLFALPLLEKDSVLEVIPPIESKAYIEMTLEVLAHFGVKIIKDENCYRIKGNQSYCAKNVTVEGDYSNAAFLDAFNLIGGDVKVEGLREDSLQGDQVYGVYFETLKEENACLDIAECPDLGPILMGMAAALNGARFTGTRRLKIKESDRGMVMAQELRKFGIQTEVLEEEITVFKGKLQKPQEVLDSHNDHRIAMTMAVLSTITGGVIDGAQAVRKSFPNYFEAIETLGIDWRKIYEL